MKLEFKYSGDKFKDYLEGVSEKLKELKNPFFSGELRISNKYNKATLWINISAPKFYYLGVIFLIGLILLKGFVLHWAYLICFLILGTSVFWSKWFYYLIFKRVARKLGGKITVL